MIKKQVIGQFELSGELTLVLGWLIVIVLVVGHTIWPSTSTRFYRSGWPKYLLFGWIFFFIIRDLEPFKELAILLSVYLLLWTFNRHNKDY